MADESATAVVPSEQNPPAQQVAELYEGTAADEPEQELEQTPEAEVAKVEETPEQPAKVETLPLQKHSTADIEKAAGLGIPASDIDDMTPKELARTIAHLDRFGRHVWESATKQAPKAPEKKDEEEQLWDEETEKMIAPELVAPIKKMSAELKRLKAQEKEIADLKQQLQADRIERVHSRIDNLLSKDEDVAQVFDRTTAKGQAAFKELMVTMRFVQDKGRALGKDYSEKEILERSIREMGVVQKASPKDEKDEQLEKRKEEFKNGALGIPTSRGESMDPKERLRKVLEKRKMRTSAQTDNAVEWR